VICVNGTVVAEGAPPDVFTSPILSRTFNTEMRVVRDAETGSLLVAEAGRHGPFARGLSAIGYRLSANGRRTAGAEQGAIREATG
jgi:hypothetical protein